MAYTRAERLRSRIQELSRRQHGMERHLGAGLGVDHAGLMTVNTLMSDGPTTPSVLAREVGVSPAAMSVVLERLEAAGHVTRTPHPSDRRKVVVTPSADTGVAAMALVDPLIAGIVRIAEDLDDTQQAVVEDFLDRLIALYRDVSGD